MTSHPRSTLLLAAVLLLGSVGVAAAHDTWLLPASMRVPVGRAVTLHLTSGMAFPADDFAINPSRLARSEVRLAGATSRLARPAHGDRSLRYRWTPAKAGVATIVVELAPKTLTLAPHLVKEYLDEIDASPALRAAWDRMADPKQWRERYVKHAASFVRVGAACGDTSWRAPMGLGLEIVPLADPTALRAGDTLPVQVLLDGRPHAAFAIGARPAGKGIAAFSTTDASGRATVTFPTAGQWLLAGTDLRRTTAPGLEWESDFATMTLAVRDHGAARDCNP